MTFAKDSLDGPAETDAVTILEDINYRLERALAVLNECSRPDRSEVRSQPHEGRAWVKSKPVDRSNAD